MIRERVASAYNWFDERTAVRSLVRKGLYESQGYGRTRQAHDWSYGRAGFPLYCTHCSFMNEKMPIEWSGYPLYPSDPPEDFSTDPCTWYWYKDPQSIPERHWSRYSAVKPSVTGAT